MIDDRHIYAWVALVNDPPPDEAPRRWSLITMANEQGTLPLLTHNFDVIKGLREIALEYARTNHQTVALVRWSALHVLEQHGQADPET